MRATPIVKWAGGKGQLLPRYARYLPDPGSYDAYLEPFVGGGALFFYLAPSLRGKFVWLNDNNTELINLYRVIAADPEPLIERLREYRDGHSREQYYRVRAAEPQDPVERAARLLYLNKTCYNGLYRVNSRGQFNVPMGRYGKPAILDEPALRSAHRVFRDLDVAFSAGDFEEAAQTVQRRGIRRAFVYFDPPYQPISETAYFTAYTSDGFSEDDQLRLAALARRLKDGGHLVMVSNSYHALIRELYEGFTLIPVQANRAINSRADGRGAIYEYLILGYPGGSQGPARPPGRRCVSPPG
ncbi:MAG: DNA adenine methylase [Bacillota bacterium]